jgi:fibronectin type 3 domain-containing protein
VLAPIAPSTLAERILNLQERYPPEAYAAMMNLLGSHDTNRPLFMLDHNAHQDSRALYENPAYDWSDAINRQKGVALLQGTLPGAPTIYYGDEIGLVAPPTHDGSTWQDDPYNRIPYPWADETGTPYYVHLQTAGGHQLLLDHYTTVFNARRAHPALRTGDLQILATDDDAKLFAYGRRMADSSDAAVVVVNRSGESRNVDLDVAGYLPVGASFSDVLGGGSATVGANGAMSVTVPAGGGALLVLEGTMAAPPAAVSDLAVTATSASSVSLEWSASAGANEYDVLRSLVSGGGYALAGTTNTPSFTDTGLAVATAYHYVVVARDTATLLESGHSNEASAVTGHDLGSAWYNLQWPPTITHTIGTTTRTDNIYGQIWIDGVTDAPGQAPGIRAQVGYGSGTTPDGTWTWEEMSFNGQVGNNDEYVGSLLPDAVGAFNYATRYSTNNGATWNLADLSGPRPDGTLSNPGVLTVNASSDATPPAAPELSLAGNTASSISLAWTAPTDPDLAGYELLRDGVEIAQFGASATAYTDEDVTTGQTYTYTIRAFDTSFNRSADSNEVEATAENRMVQVTFTVAVPEFTPADATIFVTGSISQLGPWNPGAYPMTSNSDGTWSRTFSIPDGTSFEWKYTRGNWETVEQWGDIVGVANRGPATAQYGADGTMTIDNTATSGPESYQQIGNWRDPLVVSHSPEDGATDVPTDTTVVVNWSKPMPASTSFSVKDGEGAAVAGSFARSNDDQTVTFTPDGPLTYSTTYQVAVSGQGGGGDIQQVPTSFSFTTAEAPAAVLESIAVAPVDPTLTQGQTERFTATGHYDDGTEADLTRVVTWSTSDKKVANVNRTGLVQPKSAGTATITAALDGVEGQSLVTVVPRRSR